VDSAALHALPPAIFIVSFIKLNGPKWRHEIFAPDVVSGASLAVVITWA
jgi:hypothetical protein